MHGLSAGRCPSCHLLRQCSSSQRQRQDSPGDLVVKSPPANAGDKGSVPGLEGFHVLWGNSAHAPQLLSPHARACEPQALKPEHSRAHALQKEKPPQLESSPHSPKLEKTYGNKDPVKPKK